MRLIELDSKITESISIINKNNRKNLFEEYKKKDKLEVRKIEEIINEKKRKNTEFKDMQKNNQEKLSFLNNKTKESEFKSKKYDGLILLITKIMKI